MIRYLYEPRELEDKTCAKVVDHKTKRTINDMMKLWGDALEGTEVTYGVRDIGTYQAVYRSHKGASKVIVSYKDKKEKDNV